MTEEGSHALLLVCWAAFLLLVRQVALAASPDINGDLDVDGADIGRIIGAWGWEPEPLSDATHPADLNADDKVDGSDLGIALGAWSGPGVLWQPYTVAADDRMSTPVSITVPAGATVTDAETIGGPLWRGVRAFVLPRDDPHAPMVVIYELPADWNPSETERADIIKSGATP
jgi:hypothetical protein